MNSWQNIEEIKESKISSEGLWDDPTYIYEFNRDPKFLYKIIKKSKYARNKDLLIVTLDKVLCLGILLLFWLPH